MFKWKIDKLEEWIFAEKDTILYLQMRDKKNL